MSIFKPDFPSYKTPGVYPDGTDLEVGLDSSNLLQDSLGNWNNLIRDEGPVDDEGNSIPRVFVSFASDTELVTPTADASGQEAIGRRPIFIKVSEDLIRQYGFTTILTKGYSWDDWFVSGSSTIQNAMNEGAVAGKIKNRDTFQEYQNFGGNVELQDIPWDLGQQYDLNASGVDQADLDEDDISGASSSSETYVDMGVIKQYHEVINEYIKLVQYYWNVTKEDVVNFIQVSEAGTTNSDRRALWDTLTEGKFRNNLFNNPISVDGLLSYIRPTNADIEDTFDEAVGLSEDETWTIELHSDINTEDITANLSVPFHVDAYYNWNTDVSGEDFTSQNATLYGEFTDKRYFPRAFEIINPSEISNYNENNKVFVQNLLSFPVESEQDPVSNIIVDNINTTQEGLPTKMWKLGYPFFSYDYIFGDLHSAISGDEQIELPAAARENTNYEVNCYFEHDNEQIPLKYYDIDSEE